MADSPRPGNKEKIFKRKSYNIATTIELLDLYHKDKETFSKTLSEKQINPTTVLLWLRIEEKRRIQAETADITQMKRFRPSPLHFVDDGL